VYSTLKKTARPYPTIQFRHSRPTSSYANFGTATDESLLLGGQDPIDAVVRSCSASTHRDAAVRSLSAGTDRFRNGCSSLLVAILSDHVAAPDPPGSDRRRLLSVSSLLGFPYPIVSSSPMFRSRPCQRTRAGGDGASTYVYVAYAYTYCVTRLYRLSCGFYVHHIECEFTIMPSSPRGIGIGGS
jgi:hypothetical protein